MPNNTRSPFVMAQDGAGIKSILDTRYVPGNVFWVQSTHANAGDSAGHGTSPDAPFATLAYALANAVTANQGDIILVMPGHAETIAAAAGIVHATAGVRVIGLGRGSNKPRFTWSATASTWTITAANCSIENIDCVVSVDEVVKLFSVTAAHALFDGVNFYETSTKQAIQFLLTDANGDDLEVRNCRHFQNTAAAAAQAWISLVGADRAYIHDNIFHLTLNDAAAGAVIKMATTACHDSVIANNLVRMTGYTANLLSAFLDSASSRVISSGNRVGTDVAANTTINDVPAGWSFDTLGTNAVDKSGILDPVVDT